MIAKPAAAVALRGLRREIMAQLRYSLRALDRTLEEPGTNPVREAHTRLDTAVRAAYAMSKDADPFAFLLKLNLACAAKEKAGEPITHSACPSPKPNVSLSSQTTACGSQSNQERHGR
jgi:hypothetical protein